MARYKADRIKKRKAMMYSTHQTIAQWIHGTLQYGDNIQKVLKEHYGAYSVPTQVLKIVLENLVTILPHLAEEAQEDQVVLHGDIDPLAQKLWRDIYDEIGEDWRDRKRLGKEEEDG